MTLSTLSVVQQILQETKHGHNISRSTSNKRSQAQEFNVLDVLVKSQVAILRTQNKISLPSATLLLFIVELGVRNLQFHQTFLNILQISLPIKLTVLEHSLFANNVAKIPNLANWRQAL